MARLRRSAFTIPIALGLLAISGVTTLRAQALVVVVTDSARGTALEGAMVSLLDKDADLLAAQRSSPRGRAVFRVITGAGHYAVQVIRFGYQPLVTNWIPVADTDTLEVTIRMRALTALPEVMVTAARDSIAPLLPPGINPKAMAGRIVVPAEVDRHAMGARDYVDILESVGIAGVTTRIIQGTRFRAEYRCLGSLRGGQGCVDVLVNNVRMPPDQAVDLATPENLSFAVWLRPEDAGVLYGTGTIDGVLLLYTKDWVRARSARPPM
jgi:hypothetical protein